MFELTISKQQLLFPLLTVAGAVDKKQSLAILSNILLKITDSHLLLTATDLEIEITACIPFHASQGTGMVTVPTKKIIDIIRSLDEDALPSFLFDADILAIKEGRSLFKLGVLAADDYPHTEQEKNEVEFSISRQALIRLFQSTHFAISQQDVRVFLNGTLFEIDPNSLTVVATDGHRMAICKLPCQLNSQHQRFLIPRKGLLEMLRFLGSIDEEEVLIAAGKSHFKLITSQYTFLTKLLEARFPSYVKAIPTAQDKHVVIDRDLLKRALSRISILAHEKSRAISLTIQDGQLTLAANNQNKEEAVETLTAVTEGEPLTIGINASYLLDMLNYIDEGLVRLSFANTDSSILVESLQDEHYQYVIMPMKL